MNCSGVKWFETPAASRHLLTAVGRSHGPRDYVHRLSRKSEISVRPRGTLPAFSVERSAIFRCERTASPPGEVTVDAGIDGTTALAGIDSGALLDDGGFYVTNQEGVSTSEQAQSKAGEKTLMWRCGECGEVGDIDDVPAMCPSCGASGESISYLQED